MTFADREDKRETLNGMALLYLGKGRYGESIEIFEALLVELKADLGEDDPETLRAESNLALAIGRSGRPDEAIVAFERLVERSERVLGASQIDVVRRRINLATNYALAQRHDEAANLLEVSLAAITDVLGPSSPEVLSATANLALSYSAAGRVQDATTVVERLVRMSYQVLGEDHPESLERTGFLAGLYRSGGRVEDSVRMLELLCERSTKSIGPEHPDTISWSAQLASSYIAADRQSEAVPLLEEAVLAAERVFGANAPTTIRSKADLARLYSDAPGRRGDRPRGAEFIQLFDDDNQDAFQALVPVLAVVDDLLSRGLLDGDPALRKRVAHDREVLAHEISMADENGRTAATALSVAQRVLAEISPILAGQYQPVLTQELAFEPVRALHTLTAEGAAATQAALEQPLAELSRLLDDPGFELDPVSEDKLRRLFGTISLNLSAIEPDRFLIERSISLVITTLVELGGIGAGTRAVLMHLGAEPEALVDGIILTLQAIVEVIVEEWGSEGEVDPGIAIQSAGHLSSELARAIRIAIEHSPVAASLLESESSRGLSQTEARNARLDAIVIRTAEAIANFADYWVLDADSA